MLAGTQLLRSLTRSESYLAITEKALQGCLEKGESRLTSSLVEVYSRDYNPDPSDKTESHGMKVLEHLRKLSSHLLLVKPLVQVLNAKPGSPEYQSSALLAAAATTNNSEANIITPPCLLETAMKRQLLAVWKAIISDHSLHSVLYRRIIQSNESNPLLNYRQ